MKKYIYFFFLFSFQLKTIHAQKPFKVITLDLDTRQLDSVLPIEEPFYLTFTKKDPFSLDSFRLFKIRIRNSYSIFNKNQVLLYENLKMGSSLSKESDLEKVSIHVVKTITESDTGKKSEIKIEKTYTIDSMAAKNYVTIFLPALTPYCYYYILNLKDPLLVKNKVGLNDLVHKIDNKDDINQEKDIDFFEAIHCNSTIPLGNTAFNRPENINRRITATLGMSYLSLTNKAILPYAGLRYSFVPISKWERQGAAKMSPNPARCFERLAFDIGATFTSIEDTTSRIKNLTGNINLLTGLGYRLSDFTYLSAGCIWYKKVSEADKTKTLLTPSFYLSLSLDWDVGQTFSAFTKLIGF